jgi:hypothetical protein
MKKYFIGLFAIASAICFSAYTTMQSSYTFEFTANIEFPNDANYDDIPNWDLTTPASCSGTEIPCRVVVLQSAINPFKGAGESEESALVDYLVNYRTVNGASAMESHVEVTLTQAKKDFVQP